MKIPVTLALLATLDYAAGQVVSGLTSALFPNSSTTSTTSSVAPVTLTSSNPIVLTSTTAQTSATDTTSDTTSAGETVPTGSQVPTTTETPTETPTVTPVVSSTAAPVPSSTTTGGNPYGTSNPVIGIENIYIENVVVVVVKRLQRRQTSTTTLGIAHRDIYPQSTASIPYYPAVIGFPPAGGSLLVATRSNVAATPDPTPIFTFSYCAACPATITTAELPGYVPGACVGCTLDSGIISIAASTSTTPGGNGLITTVTATQTLVELIPVITTCPNGEISWIPKHHKTWCETYLAWATVPEDECTTYVKKKKHGFLTTCTEAKPGWTPAPEELTPVPGWGPGPEWGSSTMTWVPESTITVTGSSASAEETWTSTEGAAVETTTEASTGTSGSSGSSGSGTENEESSSSWAATTGTSGSSGSSGSGTENEESSSSWAAASTGTSGSSGSSGSSGTSGSSGSSGSSSGSSTGASTSSVQVAGANHMVPAVGLGLAIVGAMVMAL